MTACPDRSTLSAFALGELSAERIAGVDRHIEGCPDCAVVVEELDGTADPLVSALRTIGPDVDRRLDPGGHLARELERGPCRLDKFELLEELGIGSFGYVFRARDTELDRIVALKVQRAGDFANPRERERFVREARSAAQLEHEHIVTLYESGQTEGGVNYLVSEFIDGMTLEQLIATRRPDFRAGALLVSEVAMALQYAHAHGVIHRDVKPSNILIDGAGKPHVADFGLAKREVGEATVTADGEILGTPAYMSPELARGESHQADARGDVYSLGVILYELLAGDRPFSGNRRMLMLQVLDDEPRPPHRLDDKVPRDLETICLKAMAKSPQRRYQSAEELAADLTRYLDGDAIRARPVGIAERTGRWSRKNPLAVGLLFAVVLGSGFGFWHLTQLSRDLVRGAAFDSAEQYSDLLVLINDFYSSEVVDRTGNHGIAAMRDYLDYEKAIPLPATMLKLLLDRIGDTDSGMRGRQYSGYPLKSQENGGPHDDFQRDALAHLTNDPSEPFYRFVDDAAGQPVLRYARARVMEKSCVACHNGNPDSSKNDWHVGDVRGVLEIVRPLAADELRTRQGLQGTFVLMFSVGVLLAVCTLIAALFRGRRQRS